jgi:DNA-binding MarR family transcriptional regulator
VADSREGWSVTVAGRRQLDFDKAVAQRLGPMSQQLDLGAFQAVWLLHQAADAARRYLEAAALSRFGLSWTRFEVLWHLWIFGEDEPRHICDAIGIPKSSLTTTVVQLEQAGYVKRRGSAEDGRRVIVTITERGTVFMGRVFPGFNRAEAQLTGALTADQTAQLASLLRLVIDQEHLQN